MWARWCWLSSDVTVAGAGVFGSWIALTLRRACDAVTLVDPFGPAHSRASSGGESRIIRCAYGADEIYTRMAQRSLTLWKEFFAATGNKHLFQQTGVLWLAEPEDSACRKLMLWKAGRAPRNWHQNECSYTDVAAAGEAIYEPDAGALMARQAVQAVVAEFERMGGVYRQEALGLGLAGRGVTIYACGPWLGKLFPEILGPRLFVTRQEILFFGTPAETRDSERRSCLFGSIFGPNEPCMVFPISKRGVSSWPVTGMDHRWIRTQPIG